MVDFTKICEEYLAINYEGVPAEDCAFCGKPWTKKTLKPERAEDLLKLECASCAAPGGGWAYSIADATREWNRLQPALHSIKASVKKLGGVLEHNGEQYSVHGNGHRAGGYDDPEEAHQVWLKMREPEKKGHDHGTHSKFSLFGLRFRSCALCGYAPQSVEWVVADNNHKLSCGCGAPDQKGKTQKDAIHSWNRQQNWLRKIRAQVNQHGARLECKGKVYTVYDHGFSAHSSDPENAAEVWLQRQQGVMMPEDKIRGELEQCALCNHVPQRRYRSTTGARWTQCTNCNLGNHPADFPHNKSTDKLPDDELDASWNQTQQILRLAPAGKRRDLLKKLVAEKVGETVRVVVACGKCGTTTRFGVHWPWCPACHSAGDPRGLFAAPQSTVEQITANYKKWNAEQVALLFDAEPEPCICGSTDLNNLDNAIRCKTCNFGGAGGDIVPGAVQCSTGADIVLQWNTHIKKLQALVAELPACDCGSVPQLRPQGNADIRTRRYQVQCSKCDVKTSEYKDTTAAFAAWRGMIQTEGVSFLDKHGREHCALCGEAAKMGDCWPWCLNCHREGDRRDLFMPDEGRRETNTLRWNREQRNLRQKQLDEGWKPFNPKTPLLVAPCAKCGKHYNKKNGYWPACDCGQWDPPPKSVGRRRDKDVDERRILNIQDWNALYGEKPSKPVKAWNEEQAKIVAAEPVNCSCGGKAVMATSVDRNYYVVCERCHYDDLAHDASPASKPTREEAVQVWNAGAEERGATKPVKCSCGAQPSLHQDPAGCSYHCHTCYYSNGYALTKQKAIVGWNAAIEKKLAKNPIVDVREDKSIYKSNGQKVGVGEALGGALYANSTMIKNKGLDYGPTLTTKTYHGIKKPCTFDGSSDYLGAINLHNQQKEKSIMNDIKTAVDHTNTSALVDIKFGAKQAAAVKAEKVVMEQVKKLLGDNFPEGFYTTPLGEAVLDIGACYLTNLATHLFPQMVGAETVREYSRAAMTGVTAKAAAPLMAMAKSLISNLAENVALVEDDEE